jgi:hypothetical protein
LRDRGGLALLFGMRQPPLHARPGDRWAPIAIPEDRVVGLRYARLLDHQLRGLRGEKPHANRTLFYDHVVVAHLLAFFNPAVVSLRKIEDAFENRSVRKHFGTPRVPKSTLADAQRLFDPDLLLPLIKSLQQRVGVAPHDPRLDDLTRKLLAVDGSFFAVAPRVLWALYNQTTKADTDRPIRKGQVRGHFHFDILRGIPDHVTLTDGQAGEAEQLRAALEPGCLYVIDRGFQQYQLLFDIIKAHSDFVVRLRKSASLDEVQTRPLTAADRQAGVLSDTLVRVGWRDDQTPLDQPLRCVKIAQADKPDEPIFLLTNRTDLAAHLIGLLYHYRWQIELFFRWLKCMAGFGHFFSESREGMTLQIYVAMIATLLIAVETGGKPSGYDYSLMSLAVAGLASMEEVLATAARRRAERQRAAERAKARAAMQKNAR